MPTFLRISATSFSDIHKHSFLNDELSRLITTTFTTITKGNIKHFTTNCTMFMKIFLLPV